MENSKAKYNIIDKHISGLEITKFTLESIEDKKQASVSYEDVLKLARVGKLGNAKALLDITSGNYILDCDEQLKDMVIHKGIILKLNCRIMSNNKCVGYKAQDANGKNYKVSINKIWDMAITDAVENVEAKIIDNKKVLVGKNGFRFSSLPKINE